MLFRNRRIIKRVGYWPEMESGQAETYAYGLSFGHMTMKESYVAEANFDIKKGTESFRDFGQTIEDLCCHVYPYNREHVQESWIKTFMAYCSDMEEYNKWSDIEQQSPFGDCKNAIHCLFWGWGGGGWQNQRECPKIIFRVKIDWNCNFVG